MASWNQDLYLDALNFAALAHLGQTIPGGDVPYTVHLCQVAMEVMASPAGDDLSLACALLHDTLEDTSTSFEELRERFGSEVAIGVLALTKNEALPKAEQMLDSLKRLRDSSPKVQLVKLADRITNLQEPPHYWSAEKRLYYRAEAGQILEALAPSDPFLAVRLETKIREYARYL